MSPVAILSQALKQSPFGKVNVFTTVWLTKVIPP
jgi:hypothetical protein